MLTYQVRERNKHAKEIRTTKNPKQLRKTKGSMTWGRIQITQPKEHVLAEEEQMTAARTKQREEEKHTGIVTWYDYFYICHLTTCIIACSVVYDRKHDEITENQDPSRKSVKQCVQQSKRTKIIDAPLFLPDIATPHRKGHVLPPTYFQRSVERQSVVQINGWVMTSARVF